MTTHTAPTSTELDAAENIGAPAGETPRYSLNATLTFVEDHGWFVLWTRDNGKLEIHPYGSNYPDALSAWEKVAR
jgi:hypothetical protein